MIRFYYEEADAEGGGGLVEFTDRVNLSDGNVHVSTQAEQGGQQSNSFVVDDPDGDWSTYGHRRIYVIEDDAPAGNQLIAWLYTGKRTISRGGGDPTEAARKWDIEVTDINTALARKVMAGNDSDRPAETDVERIQWLLTTGEAGWIGDTTTFVDTANPVAMDAVDYNGQMFNQIVDDCAQQSGKNYYVRSAWNGAAYEIAFWYAADDAALALSDLRISNVESDVDYVDTWPASLDSNLVRDPSRVYSGMFGNYDGGFTYQTRFATIDDFANRDTVTSWPNVKTLAKAQARAQSQLQRLHTEEDVISTTILVAPANVNDAMAGDQIDARFSHLPGYESFTPMRILDRTVTFLTPREYQIDYSLSPLPVPPADMLIAFIAYTNSGMVDPVDLSTNGWTQGFATGDFKWAGQFPGPGHSNGMAMWYREVVPGESADVLRVAGGALTGNACWVYQVAGLDIAGVDASGYGTDITMWPGIGGEVTVDSPSAGSSSFYIGGWMLQKVTYGQFTGMTNSQGTGLGDVNANNDPTTVNCGVNDGAPPTVHMGYEIGTGVLTLGATFDCCGSGPGCYNGYGRGYGGLLFPILTTPSIVQQGFQVAAGADCVVTMPSPP